MNLFELNCLLLSLSADAEISEKVNLRDTISPPDFQAAKVPVIYEFIAGLFTYAEYLADLFDVHHVRVIL